MENSTFLDPRLIAPCGIHCGTCYAYLREKNKCPGCRLLTVPLPNFRLRCKIANCPKLVDTKSGFCYECDTIPFKRLKDLDIRYRTRYNTGLIQNLVLIKEKGMNTFLTHEIKKRTCPVCGSIISIHKDSCVTCK
jgi:Protein of unknown function (DUF3795)